MTSRTPFALLLLGLFGATLILQVALADDAVAQAGHGDIITASKFGLFGIDLGGTSNREAGDVDDDVQAGDYALGEIQPYVYIPDADEVEADADDEDQDLLDVGGLLERLLHGHKFSKNCWSEGTCLKFYSKPGCCRSKCVNLDTSNGNCGMCKKYCDTKRGYFCRSGKCRKLQSHVKTCNERTDCKGMTTCCGGKCVNVQQDRQNCGTCGGECPWGTACCGGECKGLKTDANNCGACGRTCPRDQACCLGGCTSLKTSSSNCGKCGKSCGYGRKCCDGQCVSVISDKDNCGRCGRNCPDGVMCIHGICGYGT